MTSSPRPTPAPLENPLASPSHGIASAEAERAMLTEIAQRRAERLQLLQEAGQMLASSLDETEIVRQLARQVERLVPCDGVAIVLVQDSAGHRPVARRSGGVETPPRAGDNCDALVDAVLRERGPVSLDESRVEASGGERREGSLLGVPAYSGSSLVAVIAVWAGKSSAFAPEDQDVLLTIGAHAGSALSNARLYMESQRERRRSEALADIARAVSGSLRLDDVMDLILRHAVALLRVQGAGLALVRGEHLEVVAGVGAGSLLVGATLPISGSVSGRALRLRSYQIVNESADDPEAFAPTRAAADIRRALTVPLFTSEGPVGVLSAINRASDFTEEDAAVLQRLADHVAVAIVNAKLFEEHHALGERYRRVLETASDAIVITDRDRRVSFTNPAANELFGVPDAVGMPVSAFVPPELLASVRAHEDRAFAGEPQRYEATLVRGPDERRYVSVSTAPLRDGDQIVGVVASLHDITEEKRLTEQLVQQEKLAAVGQLVSGVAHELNNPLAGVMAFAELLLVTPPSDQEQHRAIEAIHQEAKRAAKIVSNLLTFARQHRPERVATELNQVVSDTLDLRRYAISVGHIELDLRLDPTLPSTMADPFQLQQVVLNLITNAEHELAQWNGERRIVVATERQGDTLVLTVKDTGPGIPEADISRIFDPFYTTKPVGQGTGLGLSISDGIVREHGGRIRVESRPGEGATFTVAIPFVPPVGEAPPGAPEPRPTARTHRRILVVDDEGSIRAAIARYLRSLGHDVHTAAGGREALERIGSATYDAAVIDLRMPDMSGDALLMEMRVRAPALAERVLFLTGDTQSDEARAQLAATGRPSLAKPFLLEELAMMLLPDAEG